MEYLVKLKTLLTAFPTYAVAVVSALTIVSEELPSVAGNLTKIIAGIGACIVIVRRVTPVIPEDRGLSPIAYPEPAKK